MSQPWRSSSKATYAPDYSVDTVETGAALGIGGADFDFVSYTVENAGPDNGGNSVLTDEEAAPGCPVDTPDPLSSTSGAGGKGREELNRSNMVFLYPILLHEELDVERVASVDNLPGQGRLLDLVALRSSLLLPLGPRRRVRGHAN